MTNYNFFNYQEAFEIFLRNDATKSPAFRENKTNQLIVFRNIQNSQEVVVDENEWLNLKNQIDQLFEENYYAKSTILEFDFLADDSVSSTHTDKSKISATTQKGYLNVFQMEDVLISLDEVFTNTEDGMILMISIIKNMKVIANFQWRQWEDIKSKINELYLQ